VDFVYLKQPANRYTFQAPKLLRFVVSQCRGKTLNLFAGKTTLCGVDEFRVDVDPDMPQLDYVGDCFDFLQGCKEEFNTVVLDPPFNIRKSREKYEGRWMGAFRRVKEALLVPGVLASDARVITLGYDTVGMSASRGFKKLAVCIVCHSGDHNDTLCLVEERDSK